MAARVHISPRRNPTRFLRFRQQGYLGVATRRVLGGSGGFNPAKPDFALPLADLGAGAVDTTPTVGGVSATFTRATTATTVLSNRLIGSVASGTARSCYSPAGVYLGYLSELQSTNLVLQSENFGTTWVAIGTPTRVAASDTCGVVVLDLIGDDDGAVLEGYSQVIGFTADAAKCVSIFVKAGTSTSTVIRLRDTTAGANRLLVALAWAGGVPTPTYTTGSACGLDALGNGVYRVRMATTAVTAANTNQVEVYPATDASLAIANTGTVLAGGVQAENALTCSSYIPTTVATVTRNADFLKYVQTGIVDVSKGTAYAEVTLISGFPTSLAATFINTDSGSGGKPLFRAGGSALTTVGSFDGVTVVQKVGIADLSAGAAVKVASVWSGVTQQVGQTSLALASGLFDGSMGGDNTTIAVGCTGAGAQQMGGTILNVKLWKSPANASQVAGL